MSTSKFSVFLYDHNRRQYSMLFPANNQETKHDLENVLTERSNQQLPTTKAGICRLNGDVSFLKQNTFPSVMASIMQLKGIFSPHAIKPYTETE